MTPPPRKRAPHKKLENGQQIYDRRNELNGVVLDFACQFAHPNADPVYAYLIRWEDGQIQAISQHAVEGNFDFELIDDDQAD